VSLRPRQAIERALEHVAPCAFPTLEPQVQSHPHQT